MQHHQPLLARSPIETQAADPWKAREVWVLPWCNHVRYSGIIQAGQYLIKEFRDKWLRDFYLRDVPSKHMPVELEKRLFRKLQLIDDAVNDSDLRSPPGNHFEKMAGTLAGMHSVRINRQWRLVFSWPGKQEEVCDIYLDSHDYR